MSSEDAPPSGTAGTEVLPQPRQLANAGLKRRRVDHGAPNEEEKEATAVASRAPPLATSLGEQKQPAVVGSFRLIPEPPAVLSREREDAWLSVIVYEHMTRCRRLIFPSWKEFASPARGGLSNAWFRTEQFQEEVPSHLLCAICHCALHTATSTGVPGCPHVFCHACMSQWQLMAVGTQRATRCPTCNRGPLAPVVNTFAQHLVDLLPYKCPASTCKPAGCTFTGTLASVLRHWRACEFNGDTRRPCPQECGETHLLFSQLADHIRSECPETRVHCRYGCEYMVLPRIDMLQHYHTCPRLPLPCEVCGQLFRRGALAEHMAAAMQEHMRLLLEQSQSSQRQAYSDVAAAAANTVVQQAADEVKTAERLVGVLQDHGTSREAERADYAAGAQTMARRLWDSVTALKLSRVLWANREVVTMLGRLYPGLRRLEVTHAVPWMLLARQLWEPLLSRCCALKELVVMPHHELRSAPLLPADVLRRYCRQLRVLHLDLWGSWGNTNYLVDLVEGFSSLEDLQLLEIVSDEGEMTALLQGLGRSCPKLKALALRHQEHRDLLTFEGIYALAIGCREIEVLQLELCGAEDDVSLSRAMALACPRLHTLHLYDTLCLAPFAEACGAGLRILRVTIHCEYGSCVGALAEHCPLLEQVLLAPMHSNTEDYTANELEFEPEPQVENDLVQLATRCRQLEHLELGSWVVTDAVIDAFRAHARLLRVLCVVGPDVRASRDSFAALLLQSAQLCRLEVPDLDVMVHRQSPVPLPSLPCVASDVTQ